jgi:hypothetical protein
MHLLQRLITVFAKVFGLHPRSTAETPTAQQAVTLVVEKSRVSVVGGGRRPARLRGKPVRVTCTWQVTDHHGGAITLRRSGDVPVGVDDVLSTTSARIRKIGAGRRPENLQGLGVRVTTTWTVRDDQGDRVLLALVAT